MRPAAILLLGVATLAAAQSEVVDRHVGIGTEGDQYRARYGTPQWVSLEDIARGNAPAHSAFRTRGMLQVERMDRFDHSSPMTYSLTSPNEMNRNQARFYICPVPAIEARFAAEAESLRFREVEVVGTQEPEGSDACQKSSAGFAFWSYDVVEPKPPGAFGEGVLSLATVLEDAERFKGRTVKVAGQFRGRNVFGDVPAAGVPAEGWLIKDGDALLWIVGHEPKGKGFALDPAAQSDGRWWVIVSGTPETRGDLVVLRGKDVVLLSRAPHP